MWRILWFWHSSFCSSPEIQFLTLFELQWVQNLSGSQVFLHSGVSLVMCNPGTTHIHPSLHPLQVSSNLLTRIMELLPAVHKALPLESREENQGMLCTCRSLAPGCVVLPSSTQPLLGSSIHPKGGGMASPALSCLLMQSLGSSYSSSLDSSPLFQDVTMKPSLFWDMFKNRATDLSKILIML